MLRLRWLNNLLALSDLSGKHTGDIRSKGKSLMKVNNPSGPEEPGGFLTSEWTLEELKE